MRRFFASLLGKQRPARGAQPAAPERPLFQKGDWVECTYAGPWRDVVDQSIRDLGPTLRQRLIVGEVTQVPTTKAILQLLYFKSWPGVGFDGVHFRKVEAQRDPSIGTKLPPQPPHSDPRTRAILSGDPTVRAINQIEAEANARSGAQA